MSEKPIIQDEGSEEPSAPFWMTTFSDMATLLLTFFVLIVSMSTIEVKKFQEALSYFTGHTGILMQTFPIKSPRLNTQKDKQKEKIRAIRYEKIQQYIKEQGLEDKVQVNLTESGMHVIIIDSLMFPSGEAELTPEARKVLKAISGILEDDVEAVIVEGHTDNVPIRSTQYPSNWELSAARAASVVRYLLSLNHALPPERYMAVGYGEFHPRASNATPEGRAKNRRVEILFSWEPWQKTISNLQPLAKKPAR